MIKVPQRDPHNPERGIVGDCLRACVASILEMRLIDVPAFQLSPPDNPPWYASLESFLALRNWSCGYVRFDPRDAVRATSVAGFYRVALPGVAAIGIVPSPRFPGELHAIAMVAGEIWDPHPDAPPFPTGHVVQTILMANMPPDELKVRVAGLHTGGTRRKAA